MLLAFSAICFKISNSKSPITYHSNRALLDLSSFSSPSVECYSLLTIPIEQIYEPWISFKVIPPLCFSIPFHPLSLPPKFFKIILASNANTNHDISNVNLIVGVFV